MCDQRLKVHLDYALYDKEGLDRAKADARSESTFQDVKSGKLTYSEDNYLVLRKGEALFLGNLSYFRSGDSIEHSYIRGSLSYVDQSTGEDFMLSFSYPAWSVVSFADLLSKVETIK